MQQFFPKLKVLLGLLSGLGPDFKVSDFAVLRLAGDQLSISKQKGCLLLMLWSI